MPDGIVVGRGVPIGVGGKDSGAEKAGVEVVGVKEFPDLGGAVGAWEDPEWAPVDDGGHEAVEGCSDNAACGGDCVEPMWQVG